MFKLTDENSLSKFKIMIIYVNNLKFMAYISNLYCYTKNLTMQLFIVLKNDKISTIQKRFIKFEQKQHEE